MNARADADRLDFPARSLVVVGGLPGAGKTTLLERVGSRREAVVLDSADVAWRWRGVPLPYRALRPLVHGEHHLRIALAVLFATRATIVVHETATRTGSRRWMLALARLTRRSAHLVLLDVDPDTARASQLARGRAVSVASQARHAHRWKALREAAERGGVAGEAWASVRLLDRASARAVQSLELRRPRSPGLARHPRVAA